MSDSHDASVEARLREEFLAWIDRRIKITIGQQRNAYASRNDVIGSRHHAAQCELWTVRAKFEALSAVGDEAKKSEGGTDGRAQCLTTARQNNTGYGSCRSSVEAGIKPGPSDPTAERREIVARSMPALTAETMDRLRSLLSAVRDFSPVTTWREGADKILAALDGGAGA